MVYENANLMFLYRKYELYVGLYELRNNKIRIYNLRSASTYAPPHGKTNNVVSEQVRHKPAFTVTEAG